MGKVSEDGYGHPENPQYFSMRDNFQQRENQEGVLGRHIQPMYVSMYIWMCVCMYVWMYVRCQENWPVANATRKGEAVVGRVPK